MFKKSFVISAVIFACSTFPSFAESPVAIPENFCAEQDLKIVALEKERDAMALEIQGLQEEIRRLNDTIDNIRSQVGDGGVRPLSQ